MSDSDNVVVPFTGVQRTRGRQNEAPTLSTRPSVPHGAIDLMYDAEISLFVEDGKWIFLIGSESARNSASSRKHWSMQMSTLSTFLRGACMPYVTHRAEPSSESCFWGISVFLISGGVGWVKGMDRYLKLSLPKGYRLQIAREPKGLVLSMPGKHDTETNLLWGYVLLEFSILCTLNGIPHELFRRKVDLGGVRRNIVDRIRILVE